MNSKSCVEEIYSERSICSMVYYSFFCSSSHDGSFFQVFFQIIIIFPVGRISFDHFLYLFSITGPTLPMLAENMGVTLGQASWIYPVRSIAVMRRIKIWDSQTFEVEFFHSYISHLNLSKYEKAGRIKAKIDVNKNFKPFIRWVHYYQI